MAAFVALYVQRFGCAIWAEMLPTFTMAEPAGMWELTADTDAAQPLTFTPSTRSQSAGLASRPAEMKLAAELTRKSIRAVLSTTADTAAANPSASLTSTSWTVHSSFGLTWPATAIAAAALMSNIATEVPSSVSRKAVAAPIPEPPPTTTADLSANSRPSIIATAALSALGRPRGSSRVQGGRGRA